MKKQSLLLIILLLTAAVRVQTAAADVIPAFAYQGRLINADGQSPSTPLPIVIVFCLYNVPEGGTPIWGRAVPIKVTTTGHFYTELSDSAGNPLSNASFRNLADALADKGMADLWMGLTLPGMTEISPRQKISPIPYAGFAEVADHAEHASAKTFVAKSVTINNEFPINNLATEALYPHANIFLYADREDVTLSPINKIALTYGFSGIIMNYNPPANRGHDKSQTDQLTVRYNYVNSVPHTYFTLPVLKGETIYPEGTAVLETSFGKIK